MAYDPTKPANNSPVVSAELRSQFAGLKTLIDAQSAQIATLQSQVAQLQTAVAGKASKPTAGEFDPGFSDPMTAAQLMTVQSFLNDLVQQLAN
jgi:hypothetical protein